MSTQARTGEQRNRGAELNVFGEVVPGLRVLGGLALIDGEPTRAQPVSSIGNRAPGVPRVNVDVGAEIDVPSIEGLTLTGRVIYTGDPAINAANTQSLPAWTRYDIGARYTFVSPFEGKPTVIRAAVETVANKLPGLGLQRGHHGRRTPHVSGLDDLRLLTLRG